VRNARGRHCVGLERERGFVTSRASVALTTLSQSGLIGQKIRDWSCYGINSVKGLRPLNTAVGECIRGHSIEGDLLLIETDTLIVKVDFARTGSVRTYPQLDCWKPTLASRPPTARLITDGGSGVDFIEPGKTKRITFTIDDRSAN
jgi:hypothetical protein